MAGWFYALLGLIGGVASTVVGSWISSKFHVYHQNRTVHLEAIRDTVLIPLRSGLEEHFRPLVANLTPVVLVEHNAKQFDDQAKVTEEPTIWGPSLVALFPLACVFGQIESALLQDAKTNHFSELLASIDRFLLGELSTYVTECRS